MSIEWYHWNDKERLEYCDAMEYLFENWGNFPTFVPYGGPTPEISREYYKRWRFVLTHENEIVFGNCLTPGITREAFEAFKQTMEEKAYK